MKTIFATVRKLLIRVCIPGLLLLSAIPVLGADGTEVNSVVSNDLPLASAPRNNYSYKHRVWNNYVGDLLLSMGYSPQLKYGATAGGKVALDYLIMDQVSIGMQGGAYFWPEDDGNNQSIFMGIRASYHLMHANYHQRQNHWNVYLGLSVEREWGSGDGNANSEDDRYVRRFMADLHVGARYRLSKQMYIWGEAATTNLAFGVTVAI